MISLVTSKGFGDAIILRSIASHLCKTDEVEVFSIWPDVFTDMGVVVRKKSELIDYTKVRVCTPFGLMEAHPDKTWFHLCRMSCLIDEPIDMSLGWNVRNKAFVEGVLKLSGGKQILMYQPPKRPKHPVQELLVPDRRMFIEHVELSMKTNFVVKVGHPRLISDGPDMPCHHSIVGHDSIINILDLSTVCTKFFSQSSCFIPHLAQSLRKPFEVMFSSRAMASSERDVNLDVPHRLIVYPHLATVMVG